MDSYSTFKGLHFSFLHQCSRTKFFLTPRGIFYAKIQMSENQTKIENILTHWSVAQAGSNGEKNWRSNLTLPLKARHAHVLAYSALCPMPLRSNSNSLRHAPQTFKPPRHCTILWPCTLHYGTFIRIRMLKRL